MAGGIGRRAALVVSMVLVAACGGTIPPAATQNGGGEGDGTEAPVTATPVATEAPVATQSGGGGGGDAFAGDPCSLLTADEVGGILGGSGWTSQGFPVQGGSGQCLYTKADGSSLAAISITTGVNMPIVWDAYAANTSDVASVAGIGDEAIFSTSTESLFFLKGATMVGITAGTGSDGYDLRLQHAKEMGAIVDGRL